MLTELMAAPPDVSPDDPEDITRYVADGLEALEQFANGADQHGSALLNACGVEVIPVGDNISPGEFDDVASNSPNTQTSSDSMDESWQEIVRANQELDRYMRLLLYLAMKEKGTIIPILNPAPTDLAGV